MIDLLSALLITNAIRSLKTPAPVRYQPPRSERSLVPEFLTDWADRRNYPPAHIVYDRFGVAINNTPPPVPPQKPKVVWWKLA